jgi:transketolase C-terminal domain/subunit
LEGYNEYNNSKLFYKNFKSNENLFCIISTGPISYNVFEAVEDLGISLLHIHIPFLKNIDKDAISNLCKNCVKIFIFEEHSKIGGLFSAISEILLMSSHFKGIQVNNFGIDDQFVHQYGTQENIWASFNLDKKSIKEILITHK